MPSPGDDSSINATAPGLHTDIKLKNEAARVVEDGVASAEDIDTAVRVGFGLRFSVSGLLDFID
ncbi:3-hydroxyacyl-CoA dehydrogenase family protein [Pseudomonas sp. GB2N2]